MFYGIPGFHTQNIDVQRYIQLPTYLQKKSLFFHIIHYFLVKRQMVQMALPIINFMYKTMEKWQKMWFCHNQMQWFAKDADVYLNKIGILMTWYIVKPI